MLALFAEHSLLLWSFYLGPSLASHYSMSTATEFRPIVPRSQHLLDYFCAKNPSTRMPLPMRKLSSSLMKSANPPSVHQSTPEDTGRQWASGFSVSISNYMRSNHYKPFSSFQWADDAEEEEAKQGEVRDSYSLVTWRPILTSMSNKVVYFFPRKESPVCQVGFVIRFFARVRS